MRKNQRDMSVSDFYLVPLPGAGGPYAGSFFRLSRRLGIGLQMILRDRISYYKGSRIHEANMASWPIWGIPKEPTQPRY
ncbi:hypothetical protein POX_c03760 [Penicillium oxalicum]|uniref:hypothetical protein n=1 Tax=Penicillium oxalicum TaxID=69781 RepID=UPI0020B6BFDC|nr:hypothetical protein POX_c03760 [Penicillium oxalicum]KAI2790909.1 hypothetical protein POX_c03760 [Penicillium oxalicum]